MQWSCCGVTTAEAATTTCSLAPSARRERIRLPQMARLRRDRVAIRVDERDRRGGDVEDDLPLTHDRRADDGAAALVVEDGDAVVARFGAVRVEEAARLRK